MAMELEFWLSDGPNGEQLDFARRVQAWEILPTVERYRTPNHVVISLRHTSRQKGEWIIWVKKDYRSGTQSIVGPIQTL